MKKLPTWAKPEDADRVMRKIEYLESIGFAFGDVDPDADWTIGTFSRGEITAKVWWHKPPTPSQFVRPGGASESGEIFTVLRKAQQWAEDRL